MKKALEGLSGVAQVEMDVEDDLFRVTLANQGAPTQAVLFKRIQELRYTPSASAPENFRVSGEALHPEGEPPENVKRALDRAKSEKKRFVLVDCMGDN